VKTIVNDDLRTLYGWVKRTREILFEYTQSLPNDVYTLEKPEFAYGSIRNVHAHVAQCYLWWIGRIGLNLDWAALEPHPSSLTDVPAMRQQFRTVDTVVEQALEAFTTPDAILEFQHPRDGRLKLTQRWLVMHPITHEFHHKGQLLAMGRMLSHPLPSSADADLVLPG
jgi:uncharacterized damage-inducible protein DinB